MKTLKPLHSLFLALALIPLSPVLALSLARTVPEIHFPAGHDAARAERIHTVLRADALRYLGGLTSFWEPKWATTLVYGGDAAALNALLAQLHRIPGLKLRVTFSPDLAKESGSGHPTGAFWVVYSHTAPDTLTVRINLAAEEMKDLALDLPAAPAER
jgi:hypothetical protein